jgi:glycogen synthase
LPREGIHPYNAADRKPKAAVVSSLLRQKGVDCTLKEMPEVVGEEWAELARQLMTEMNAQFVEKIVSRKEPQLVR